MQYNLCQLKHLSCFGCCGHDWKNKKDILTQIKKNTLNWQNKDEKQFSKESEKHLSRCGGCKSMIFKDGKIVCALHPLQNKGKDFRDKNCDKDYLCQTFKEFLTWDKKMQKKFVDFLIDKKIDHYDYSMGLDSDLFLEDFKKIN